VAFGISKVFVLSLVLSILMYTTDLFALIKNIRYLFVKKKKK